LAQKDPQGGRTFRLVPALASAITPLHPGAGRSPGVVDLPVVRDPLGFPYLPGSEVKGALKTLLFHKRGCIVERGQDNPCSGGEKKRSDSSGGGDCARICCLLGGEKGEGVEGASALSVQDFYPVMVPASSIRHGYALVTSPLLLRRALTYLKAASGQGAAKDGFVGRLIWLIHELLSKSRGLEAANVQAIQLALDVGGNGSGGEGGGQQQGQGENQGESLDILAGISIKYIEDKILIDNEMCMKLASVLGGLNPLYFPEGDEGGGGGQDGQDGGGDCGKLADLPRVYIVGDPIAKLVFEKSLIRYTRIALKRSTKTVVEGALWTEEYIPWGTLFIGAFLETLWRNRYCRKARKEGSGAGSGFDPTRELRDLLAAEGEDDFFFSLAVGGKESIGKGLVNIYVLASKNSQEGASNGGS